jgi:hypothetical protein
MNRQNRRAEVRFHRKRAKQIARSQGCTCACVELVLSPMDKGPRWSARPDSGRPTYIVRHSPTCALQPDPNEWVVIVPSGPECER